MSRLSFFKLVIYVCLFVLVAYLLKKNLAQIVSVFSHVQWWIIGLLVFLHIPIIASGGLAFQILSRVYYFNIVWQDWLGLSFIANLLNQLLPYRPGFFFRYIYLHQKYQMRSNQYMIIMSMYFLLMLAMSAIFTIMGGTFSTLPDPFYRYLMIAVIILAMSTLFLLVTHLGKRYLITSRPLLLLYSALVMLLLNVLTAAVLYWIFVATSFPLSIMECAFLAGVMIIAQVFPVTPGNIGVLETLFGTITQMIYHDFSLGFSVMALYRVSLLVPSILVGGFFSVQMLGSPLPRLRLYKR